MTRHGSCRFHLCGASLICISFTTESLAHEGFIFAPSGTDLTFRPGETNFARTARPWIGRPAVEFERKTDRVGVSKVTTVQREAFFVRLQVIMRWA